MRVVNGMSEKKVREFDVNPGGFMFEVDRRDGEDGKVHVRVTMWAPEDYNKDIWTLLFDDVLGLIKQAFKNEAEK